MENEPKTLENSEPKTFDEILENKDYQSEFDKRVTKAINTALSNEKIKWEKEATEKKTEAERLASMTAEERYKHDLKKEQDKTQKALSELNAYKLKNEAVNIATDKGLDISLLSIIDFTTETAETVNKKIDDMASSFNKAVEKAVNDRLKQNSPISVKAGTVNAEQSYLKRKYDKNPYYKK